LFLNKIIKDYNDTIPPQKKIILREPGDLERMLGVFLQALKWFLEIFLFKIYITKKLLENI